MKRIIVDKTIYNNDIETLSYLAYIQEQIFTIINLGAKMADEVDIEFKNCKYIDPTVLPLIGSIGDLLGDNGFHGKLRFQDSDESVLKYIKDSGLFTHYTNTGRADPNAIPFSICSTLDASSDIIDMFIEKAPVNLSQSAQDALSSIILEIFGNAFTHSHSKYPVYACGYYKNDSSSFTFSVYDLGVGIPYNVRNHLGNDANDLSDAACIQMAMEDGFTTSDVRYSRGIGLGVLIDFAKLNKGKLTLSSGNGHFWIDKESNEHFDSLSSPIRGTLFTVEVNAEDDCEYYIE